MTKEFRFITMTNYFCFSCRIFFLTKKLLFKHAEFAEHALHEIGQTFYEAKMNSIVAQCVCGTGFATQNLLTEHLKIKNCDSLRKKASLKCGCGSDGFIVYNQQQHAFYQCHGCRKRSCLDDMQKIEEKDVKTMGSKEELLGILQNQQSVIAFAQRNNILLPAPECPECHKLMSLARNRFKSDGYIFVCNK